MDESVIGVVLVVSLCLFGWGCFFSRICCCCDRHEQQEVEHILVSGGLPSYGTSD